MEIVGLVGVAEHRVDERGVHRARADVRGDYCGFRRAPLGARVLDRHFAGFHVCTRNHRGERVQNPVPRIPSHLGREFACPCLHHVPSQPSSDIRRGHLQSPFACSSTCV
jgi:hypothetical protein